MDEVTLIIFKPDAVERNLVGTILRRFENEGLEIVAMDVVHQASTKLLRKHYPDTLAESIGIKAGAKDDPIPQGLKVLGWNRDYMRRGTIIPAVLRGPSAVSEVRRITGFTDPTQAEEGTIRATYGLDSFAKADRDQRAAENLLHASGSREEAITEIGVWFPDLDPYPEAQPRGDFEIEVRGPLSEAQYLNLKGVLSEKGRLVKLQNRYFIDLSKDSVEERNLDVRVRTTNGLSELIIKFGDWGTGIREEIKIPLGTGQLVNAAKILAAVGFTKGIAGTRIIERYMMDGIEFALQEVPGHSHFYEAEVTVDRPGATESVRSTITDKVTSMGLEVFSPDGWFDYVNLLNREANEVFEYSPNSVEELTEKEMI